MVYYYYLHTEKMLREFKQEKGNSYVSALDMLTKIYMPLLTLTAQSGRLLIQLYITYSENNRSLCRIDFCKVFRAWLLTSL